MAGRQSYLCFLLIVVALLLAMGAVGSALVMVGPGMTVVFMLSLTAATIAARRRRRRTLPCIPANGNCPTCGYDLRASDRCPECNAPLPADLERRRRIRALLSAERGGGLGS
ncbi:MAG TPA: hypothetical protein VF669_16415 [Tepidisphaeraceae bacterium]